MKNIFFDVIKKNRASFAATKLNRKCKIILDENSQDLMIGGQFLDVIDESIHSKYGVDLIFRVVGNDDPKPVEICSLIPNVNNSILMDKIHDLGGKLDAKAWVFPSYLEEEVDRLDEKYNSKLIPVKITFNKARYASRTAYRIAGFIIATANSHNGGAKITDGIALIEGKITSGGSVKKWTTRVSRGTILKMMIPENCFNDFQDSSVCTVEKIRTSRKN